MPSWSFIPISATPEATIRPPTSTSAPRTWNRRATLMSSGRIAANISGSRLEDHVDEDQDHAGDRQHLQVERLGRAERLEQGGAGRLGAAAGLLVRELGRVGHADA